MSHPLYLTEIDQVPQLNDSERRAAEETSDRFAFRSNEYYQSLIDWTDPSDPIKRIIMPSSTELSDWGILDASDEAAYTPVPGLEHKYSSTALLLVTDVCAGYCRFCFRKRLFMNGNDESSADVTRGVAYIRVHPEISNVLLTGGDPLILSARRLTEIIEQLVDIPHVRIIRIGTKMPAFCPDRINGDTALVEVIRTFSAAKCFYIMAHFNHPRELTRQAIDAVNLLRMAGAAVVNQTPVLRGVNDTPDVLAELFSGLSFHGIPPYYVFQCRPTLGNEAYTVPVEQAYDAFAVAQSRVSGLAKVARFVISHVTGKLEVVGKSADTIYMRYHQAADANDIGRLLVLKSNPSATWFDDYEEVQRLGLHTSAAGMRVR